MASPKILNPFKKAMEPEDWTSRVIGKHNPKPRRKAPGERDPGHFEQVQPGTRRKMPNQFDEKPDPGRVQGGKRKPRFEQEPPKGAGKIKKAPKGAGKFPRKDAKA